MRVTGCVLNNNKHSDFITYIAQLVESGAKALDNNTKFNREIHEWLYTSSSWMVSSSACLHCK